MRSTHAASASREPVIPTQLCCEGSRDGERARRARGFLVQALGCRRGGRLKPAPQGGIQAPPVSPARDPSEQSSFGMTRGMTTVPREAAALHTYTLVSPQGILAPRCFGPYKGPQCADFIYATVAPGDLLEDVFVISGKQFAADHHRQALHQGVRLRPHLPARRRGCGTRRARSSTPLPDGGFAQHPRADRELPEQPAVHHRADLAGQGRARSTSATCCRTRRRTSTQMCARLHRDASAASRTGTWRRSCRRTSMTSS